MIISEGALKPLKYSVGRKEDLLGEQTAMPLEYRAETWWESMWNFYDSQRMGVFELMETAEFSQELDALAKVVEYRGR